MHIRCRPKRAKHSRFIAVFSEGEAQQLLTMVEDAIADRDICPDDEVFYNRLWDQLTDALLDNNPNRKET